MTKRFKRTAASLLTAALLPVLCTGACLAPAAAAAQSAVDPAEKSTSTGFYFDTVVTITLYGAPHGTHSEIALMCENYEQLFSKTIPSSDIGRINAANGETVTVDPETWEMLRRAQEISDDTGHLFSVTIAPLTALWDFTSGTERMPTDEERMEKLPLVDDDKMVLGDDYTVTLAPGMELDLGGIAKGYIADKVAEYVRDRCTGAILNFGGNVYVVGTKPDGSPFRVGIKDPQNPDFGTLAVVTMGDGTVVTSGTYERFFEKDGVIYHHILDPKTGLPADTDLPSVTIVGHSSMDADAYDTACVVMGFEKALAFLEEKGFDAILIDKDNNVTLTSGFTDHYGYAPMN